MLPLLLSGFLVLAADPVAGTEPRLPSPVYPGVVALADAGNPETALDSLNASLSPTDPVPIEALVLRARLLSRAGRFRESAENWRAAVTREPLLSSFAQAETVRALLDARDLQGALDGIAQLTGPPPVDILLRAGDAARAAGLLDRAAAFYKQARAGAGRTSAADQAALGLAATLERSGNPLEALEVFRELQLTFRQAAAYDAAEAGARRLSAQLNGAEPLTEQDYDTIADRLSGVAAFRRAVDVLSDWRKQFPSSARLDDIDIEIIQDLYALRANDEARARAESFLKSHTEGPEAASVFRTLFTLDAREGKTQEVERRGQAFLRGQVKDATLDQQQGVARLLAEYLVAVGAAARALPVYDHLYRITTSRSERIDIRWRTAIASLRAGNRPRAMAQLSQVRRLNLDSETDRATAYWLGEALDASGRHVDARTAWSGLLERYPFSYYGTRAASRLHPPGTVSSLAFPDLTLSDAVVAHADYRMAELLSRAGLLAEAATYARRLSGAFRRDDAVALLAARASAAAGDHSATSTIMSSFFGEYLERPSTGLPDDFWALAYPRAYWNEISAAASRHHVDPLLMVALARQESHFDRTAISPVGAIGLFQIMPTTAVELDPAFAIDRADDQLIKADIAAELAARLLEQHLARFQGALAPAIASYNADKERVQIWWDASKGLPEDLFVDSIPYRETRSYVRQVLANYSMYQRFSAPPTSP